MAVSKYLFTITPETPIPAIVLRRLTASGLSIADLYGATFRRSSGKSRSYLPVNNPELPAFPRRAGDALSGASTTYARPKTSMRPVSGMPNEWEIGAEDGAGISEVIPIRAQLAQMRRTQCVQVIVKASRYAAYSRTDLADKEWIGPIVQWEVANSAAQRARSAKEFVDILMRGQGPLDRPKYIVLREVPCPQRLRRNR